MATGTLTDPLRETLALFERSGTPRTTTELADDLDLGRRSTYDRLERLVEQGHLETKKVGANARVWWRPATGSQTGEPLRDTVTSLGDEVLDEVEAGIFVLDETFDVVWLNEAAERYFDIDRERIRGRDKRSVLREAVGPVVAEPDDFSETVLSSYEDNTSVEQFECRVTSGDGRPSRWLEHWSTPIESGTYAGGRIELYYDITHRKQTERTLGEFERLVGAVEEYAIFTLDVDGRVRTWNAGAEKIEGYEPEEILGEHFSVFYTEADREAGVPERNLTEAVKRGAVEDEGWRVRADGSRFWANVTITAIEDEEGDLQGFAKVTHDMTERHDAEQRLREKNAFIESVLNTELDVIYTFDTEGDFLQWNDQFAEVTGYTDDEIAEMHPTDFVPEDAVAETAEAIDHVFEECEALTVELPLETATGERIPYEFSASPLTDDEGSVVGLTGIGRNISERKVKERQLERQREDIASELDEVFARIDDGFYAVDEECRFTYVNDRAEELLQHSEEELLGRSVWEVFPEATETPAYDAFHTALETQEPTEYEIYFDVLDFRVEANVYPSESGLSLYFRDVTERTERERELEEYRRWTRTLIENFPAGGVALVDEDLRYVTFGGTPAGDTGVTRADLEGRSVREVLPEQMAAVAVPRYEAALEGDPSEFEETLDGRIYQFQFVPVRDDDGDVFAAIGTSQDVTEQTEYQRQLEQQIRQQEAVTNLGKQALDETSLDTLFAEASRLVAETLDTEYCKVLDMQPDDEELLLRQGVGWDDGVVGTATVSAVEKDSQAAYTLAVDEPIVVENLPTESRFSGPDLLTDHDVKSGISVVIGSHDDPWGTLGAHDPQERTFTDQDVNFVQSVANILGSAIYRNNVEVELRRQHEELAALNSINEAVHEVTGAIIEQSTREEIEKAVCGYLAGTDSYRFAWIGEIDSGSQTIVSRESAGVDGYLDDITISTGPDDERSRGPTAQALKTGATTVTRDIQTDPEYEPWRDQAREYDFRSSAAIPISHENTVYGVLNVYSERPYAFDTPERTVISQLGEIIGHAIAATERKRALMSDELVEVEFHVSDIFEALNVSSRSGGQITLDTVVPIEADEYLMYGSATPEATESLSALAEAVPYEAALRFRDDDEETFELRVSDPPVLSEVASLGGAIEDAVIEDGDYRMRVQLSPSTDVSRVTEVVQETYPGAEMVARRQITRSDDTSGRVYDVLDETLTDRQRATLRAAYHAGFFEWPRAVTAETVAESLDIAPATFAQHLRKGEKKVFDALFSEEDCAHRLT